MTVYLTLRLRQKSFKYYFLTFPNTISANSVQAQSRDHGGAAALNPLASEVCQR
jgi:hypothetical protein